MSRRCLCICILDTENLFLESYSAWLLTVFKHQQHWESIDIFIASTDLQKFNESKLNALINELKALNAIRSILRIQFHLNATDALGRKIELSQYLENFREVNQFLSNCEYGWYIQITPLTSFYDIANFSKFTNSLIDISGVYSSHACSASNEMFDFFMTGDRIIFSCLQIIHGYIMSAHNLPARNAKDLNFLFKKYLQRMNKRLYLIEQIK